MRYLVGRGNGDAPGVDTAEQLRTYADLIEEGAVVGGDLCVPYASSDARAVGHGFWFASVAAVRVLVNRLLRASATR
jgi:hypothetical protein